LVTAEGIGIGGLSFEALGWLLPVLGGSADNDTLIADIRRHLASHVYEGAGTAHFADAYEDGDYVLFHSDRRADAVLLDALIDAAERQTLVPKLVEELLTRRHGGRWANTQESVFVLLALDHYFQVYEKATPEFVARMAGRGFHRGSPVQGSNAGEPAGGGAHERSEPTAAESRPGDREGGHGPALLPCGIGVRHHG
jgi:hypothetical protein